MARSKGKVASVCVICSGGDPHKSVVRCNKCWHPYQVRTYCSRCKRRTSQDEEDARKMLFKLEDGEMLNEETVIAGCVIHFLKRCPSCYLPGESPIFAIRIHDFSELPDDFSWERYNS